MRQQINYPFSSLSFDPDWDSNFRPSVSGSDNLTTRPPERCKIMRSDVRTIEHVKEHMVVFKAVGKPERDQDSIILVVEIE